MKEIKAIIRPHRLGVVLEELHAHPKLPGITISYVQGFGKTVGREEKASADLVNYDTVSMVKVECIVNDDMLDEIVDVIKRRAHSGLPGDGKIAVYDVQELIRIRTGERCTHVI